MYLCYLYVYPFEKLRQAIKTQMYLLRWLGREVYQVSMPKEDDGMKQRIVIKTIFAKKPKRPQFLLFD